MKKNVPCICAIAAVLPVLWGCTQIPSDIGALSYNRVKRGMVFVKNGQFQMGQTGIATPLRQVTVSPFYIDNTDVTQGEYQSLMGVNPSYFGGDSLLPVISVTWFDAVLYCNARSRNSRLDTVYSFTGFSGVPGNGCDTLRNLVIDYSKKGYRLPTEAEWECACRAGSSTRYYWGDAIELDFCWDTTNSGGRPHRVGQKTPNDFGLYDMSGNVWQWCNDWFGTYGTANQTDPVGAATGTNRLLRGGSWYAHDYSLCAAYRASNVPGKKFFDVGFRCVLAQSMPSPVLSSPADGETGQPQSLTLSWLPVSNAMAYDVQVSTDSSFAVVAFEDTTLTATSKTVSGLTGGVTYYWRVIAGNADERSDWSAVWSFTTGSTQISTAGMKLIVAAGKSFQMGGTTGYSNELPVHTVIFSYDFWMDTTEVTQVNYVAVMGVNPALFAGSPILPVENVTWFDAVLYCNKRSRLEGIDTVYGYTSVSGTAGNGCTGLGNLTIDLSKNGYRLATEAEWEYACRAHTTTDYYWGSGNVNNYEWYISNSSSKTHPVATKLPNAFGLYDMSGNVAEWCSDWFGGYSSGSQADPAGPASGAARVVRGASYGADLGYHWLQSSDRENGGMAPGNRVDYLGFRCVKKSLAAATLSAPALTLPVSGDTSKVQPLKLSWSTVTNATSYRVQVSPDSSFTTVSIEDSTLTLASRTIDSLPLGVKYFWRVRAKNASGVSSWTTPWWFTTIRPPIPSVPSLVSPVNGSTSQSATPTLVWSTVSGATTYHVQVSTSSTFTIIFSQDSTLTADSMTLSGLALRATYYWRVRAKNAVGVSGWTAAWSFTTMAAPQTPTLISPVNGATGLASPVVFVWSSAPGATAYHVQVSTSLTFATIFYQDSALIEDTMKLGGLASRTTYYWRVRAKNAGGVSGWTTTWSFVMPTSIPTVPSVPTLISPANGTTGLNYLGLTLTWSTVTNATSYRVQVSPDSNFSTVFIEDSTLTSASRKIDSLPPITFKYFWRVRAKNAAGVSPWTGVWSFTTALPSAPSVPTLVSPANGSAGQSRSPTLAWSTVSGATTYHVQVSTSSTFATTAILTEDSTLTSDSMKLGSLDALTMYYWRVRAKNSGGTSSWTGPWSFTTDNATPAIDIRLGANSVVVDGTRAYVTAGTQFEVYDVSNPQTPSKLGSVTHGYTDVRVEAHAIYNNIVWCVRSSSGGYGAATNVFGVDVTNPASPVLRGTLTLQTAGSLLSNSSTIYSGYLLVHDYSRNLIYVINISNPSAPTVFSQWSVPNMVDGGPGWMLIEGTLLYLPCGETKRLNIYNLSNLAAVSLVGSVSFPQEEPYGPVVKIGFYLYLNASVYSGPTFVEAYTEVIDVANPASPAVVGTLAPNGYFKTKNGKLFSLNDAKVYSYSLANPAAPVIVDSLTVAKPAGTANLYLSSMALPSATWVGDYLIGFTGSNVAAYSGVRALYFPVN